MDYKLDGGVDDWKLISQIFTKMSHAWTIFRDFFSVVLVENVKLIAR